MRGVTAMLVLALTFSAGAALPALGDSHDDTTYYACLFGGALSQVGASPPANCGRGTLINWNVTGPPGEQGPQGAQGLQWQGNWDAGANYAVDDAVQHNGSAWISLVDNNQGNEPGESMAWDLLTQQGDQGDQGPQGAPGSPGLEGEQGPQGPVGAQWRGSWDAATAYDVTDIVLHDSRVWISNADNNVGSEPGASATWDLLVDKGDQGSAGTTGPQVPGWDGLQIVADPVTVLVPAGAETRFERAVPCPSGKRVIGGGSLQTPTGNPVVIQASSPVVDNSATPPQHGWLVRWVVRSGDAPASDTSVTTTVYVACVNPV